MVILLNCFLLNNRTFKNLFELISVVSFLIGLLRPAFQTYSLPYEVPTTPLNATLYCPLNATPSVFYGFTPIPSITLQPSPLSSNLPRSTPLPKVGQVFPPLVDETLPIAFLYCKDKAMHFLNSAWRTASKLAEICSSIL